MSKKEIEFDKYEKMGAYHWDSIGFNIKKRRPFAITGYKNTVNLILKYIDIENEKKILDIGCGDGVLSNLLSNEKKFKVYGIDLSKKAIDLAKERANKEIEFSTGSAYELAFEDNYFDVIVASDVIEHLADVPKFMSEIKRVLKKDAILVLDTPIRYSKFPSTKYHVIEWFEEDYQSLIKEYFSNSFFYKSHPIAFRELYENFRLYRILLYLLSFIPLTSSGFNSKFKFFDKQYSVSINSEVK